MLILIPFLIKLVHNKIIAYTVAGVKIAPMKNIVKLNIDKFTLRH